jgi:hypothetical protein
VAEDGVTGWIETGWRHPSFIRFTYRVGNLQRVHLHRCNTRAHAVSLAAHDHRKTNSQ